MHKSENESVRVRDGLEWAREEKKNRFNLANIMSVFQKIDVNIICLMLVFGKTQC